MKVVMLQDVGGVGQRGKIVDVSDGYALNFLIPQGKAEQATPQKEAEVKKRLETEAASRAEATASIALAIASLQNAQIVLAAKTTEKGGLFKSITAGDIAKAIYAQKKVQLSEGAIQLERPIKEIGEYTIALKSEKAASKMRLLVKSV